MEDKWTYSYIDKLQDFVNAINSRTNRVTNLALNKVTKKDVPRLISLRAEQSLKLVRRPKLYVSDYVRLAFSQGLQTIVQFLTYQHEIPQHTI